MRPLAWTVFALVGCCLILASPASAAVKLTEKTRYYQVNGRTGIALLKAMDRHGPKHGFLARAIAQTAYSVEWQVEWSQRGRACRVKAVEGKLAVTYTFPQVNRTLSPDMKRRWRVFFAGVKRHETVHGDLARRMARAAEKSMRQVSMQNDPGCRKARREVKRRLATVNAAYEAKQVQFDLKEHRDGGHVERLIDALVGTGGV